MVTKAYAGIGSRTTPADILALMTDIAIKLSEQGWVLRSGHADGADLAFETGAGPEAEIYLPWPAFNKQHRSLSRNIQTKPTKLAAIVAEQYHPKWATLTDSVQKLHARNSHQILGPHCDSPVKFVICWAPLTKDGKPMGGTAQAIRVAEAAKIPVFNLFVQEHRERLESFVLAKV